MKNLRFKGGTVVPDGHQSVSLDVCSGKLNEALLLTLFFSLRAAMEQHRITCEEEDRYVGKCH